MTGLNKLMSTVVGFPPEEDNLAIDIRIQVKKNCYRKNMSKLTAQFETEYFVQLKILKGNIIFK